MNILSVIPARYASSRFPRKPLAVIGGKPMIQWVYETVVASGVFDHVIVATDHPDIAATVSGFGGVVELTRADHASGTDRVAEVSARHPDFDVVANVQGDQPFVPSETLAALVRPFRDGEHVEMTTVGCPLADEFVGDPNTVKVVCNRRGFALYFSRASIPHYRERHKAPVYHHLGLYAFRRSFLAVYAGLPPTPLEKCEQLEQLRVLEHGYAIRVVPSVGTGVEVNTPADLDQANTRYRTS